MSGIWYHDGTLFIRIFPFLEILLPFRISFFWNSFGGCSRNLFQDSFRSSSGSSFWGSSRIPLNYSLWCFYRSFFYESSGGISGIPSGILSEIRPGVPLVISPEVHPEVTSEFPSGIVSGIPSGVMSGISPGIISGIHPENPPKSPPRTFSGIPEGTSSGIPSAFLQERLSAFFR